MAARRKAWLLVAALAAGCGDDEGAEAAAGGPGSGGPASGSPASGSGGATGEGGAGAGSGASTGGGEALCAPRFEEGLLHLAVGTSLEPGEDRTMCLRWTAPEDVEIVALQGTLGPAAGHHALVLLHDEPSGPDGVSPCSEAELMDGSASFQMLAGVSYESDGVRYEFPSAPAQIGLSVRAGQQVVLDGHFLNATDGAVEACASIDLELGDVLVPLQFRTILPEEQYGLVVPANGRADEVYEEPVGESFRVAAASSHMHEGGRHFRMSIVETGEVLYETDEWADPVPRLFETEKVVIEGEHTFRLECSFENTTSADRRFPDEMCVGGLYLLPCTVPGAC